MTTSVTPDADGVTPGADGERDSARQSYIRREVTRLPHAIWYGVAALCVAVLVVVLQIVLYQQRREPRDARAIVERELRMNTLLPGEKVVHTVAVFRRGIVDYFRATRGVLVLTDRRLIFLGAPPRDITGPSDAPPTFVQRIFPIDTLVDIESSFSILGMSRALRVESPGGSLKVGVASGGRESAAQLRETWAQRHKERYALGVWAGKVRDARVRLDTILAEYRRQPVYHVVRPGDALSSIASWYEVTPEEIREKNGISGNTIKVGERLLIRGGGKD